MRTGIGFDVHAFDESKVLVLGGVTVEGAPGLAGWSDADVLCHAIADALLGAAGAGDLGVHFSEEQVAEGTSSLELLARTAALIDEAGYSIANVDSIVCIQDVVLGPHRELMQKRIAATLGVPEGAVNVKATTTDRLGFVGRGEGTAAMAVALLEEKSET